MTSDFNVKVNINLFQKFVRCSGFLPKVAQDLGGFTVFMMTPGYQLLTGARDQPMCDFIAGKDNANELAKALAATRYYLPKTVDEMLKMLRGAVKLLGAMSDGKKNLALIGYRRAHELARKHERALTRGHNSKGDAFLTKELYRVNYILQDMYEKIVQSIKQSTAANAKVMVVSQEWLIGVDRELTNLFNGFHWQKYSIGAPPPLLELFKSPNRAYYSNDDSIVATRQAPKAGGK